MTETASGSRPISAVAGELGVAAHVLRHWEEEGLLQPARDATGARRYSDVDVNVARMILLGRSLRLGLPQMRAYFHGDGAGRRTLLAEHLARVRAEADELERTAAQVEQAMRDAQTDCPYSAQD